MVEIPRGSKFRVKVKFQNTGDDWTFGVGFTFKDSAGIEWDCYTGGCDKGRVSGGPGGAKIDSHFASAGQIVDHVIDNIPVPTAVALGDAQVLSIVWKNPTVPPSEELATTGWLSGYLKIIEIIGNFVCFNHVPYLDFGSDFNSYDSHMRSVHGLTGNYYNWAVPYQIGISPTNPPKNLVGKERYYYKFGDELTGERIPPAPQLGPYNGFTRGPDQDVQVTNPYSDKILVLIGFTEDGSPQQKVELDPIEKTGSFSNNNKWFCEFHYQAIRIR